MTWPWLTGTAVLLFTLIVTVLGVPLMLAGNWQLIQSAAHRMHQMRHRNRAELESGTARRTDVNWQKFEQAYGIIGGTPTSRVPAQTPRVMLRPDYQYDGGAVSTSAVMDPGYSMPCTITQPDSDHLPSPSALFGRGPTGAGTAAAR